MAGFRPGIQLLLFALAALVYANTLLATGFIRDDQYIILGNTLIRHWSLLPKLLANGYWEGALGASAPVQEYRPVLMLTYFLNHQLGGLAPWSYHLVNVLLHALAVVLLFKLLRRRLEAPASAIVASLFAVLPIHAEAVAYLAGRSESLVLVFLLASWLEFDAGRARRGLGFYVLALLSKEQAVLFPALLALDDWIRLGTRPWDRPRRAAYAGLAVSTVACISLRFAVLENPFHGGFDYFAGKGVLVRLLTVSCFWWRHYMVPMATGLDLRADYSRPFYPDASPADWVAWCAALSWAGLAVAAAWGAWKRRAWSLWLWLFFLPLLPTSHLIIRLDTIGAERFLYMPSIVFCALLGAALLRAPRRARAAFIAALLAFYALAAAARSRVWRSERSYSEAAVRENPFSAGARSMLGIALLAEGREAEGVLEWRKAIELNARHPSAHFNLAKLCLEKGRLGDAQRHLANAMASDPRDADSWVLRGVLAERLGKPSEAVESYRRALENRPWDAAAHFNLGRLSLAAGRLAEARKHFGEYLVLAPEADDSAQIRGLVRAISSDVPNQPPRR
jgi:Flp pilus assembly protein TadD